MRTRPGVVVTTAAVEVVEQPEREKRAGAPAYSGDHGASDPADEITINRFRTAVDRGGMTCNSMRPLTNSTAPRNSNLTGAPADS
jgi:hypothetical protein